eukprot:m51a1_g13896 dna polymerase zeta catalytic subunit, putative (2076) ;mRNA; f:718412-728650
MLRVMEARAAFAVRIEFDVAFSAFQGEPVPFVPVTHIFGATPAGQKACLHLHKALPYFFLPCPEDLPLEWERVDEYTKQLAAAMELAVARSRSAGAADGGGAKGSVLQHRVVHRISLVRGKPFYGFCPCEKVFLKVHLYDPNTLPILVNLLRSGAIFDTAFQPYEAHLPYSLQLFVDQNLYGTTKPPSLSCCSFLTYYCSTGMSFIYVSKVKFRGVPENRPFRATQTTQLSLAVPPPEATDIRERVWVRSNTSQELTSDLPRLTTCELEADAVLEDVLNLQELLSSDVQRDRKLVRSLEAMWEEERARRERDNLPAAIPTPQVAAREAQEPSRTEVLLRNKVHSIVLLESSQRGEAEAAATQERSQMFNKLPTSNDSRADTDAALPPIAPAASQQASAAARVAAPSLVDAERLSQADKDMADVLSWMRDYGADEQSEDEDELAASQKEIEDIMASAASGEEGHEKPASEDDFDQNESFSPLILHSDLDISGDMEAEDAIDAGGTGIKTRSLRLRANPPTRKQVLAGLAVQYVEPFFSNPSDAPARPLVYGGREIRVPVVQDKHIAHTSPAAIARTRSLTLARPPPSTVTCLASAIKAQLVAMPQAKRAAQRAEEQGSEGQDPWHTAQHLTLMSVEVHTHSRGSLRPNPAFDAVDCVFYCVREDDCKDCTGMLVVDSSDVPTHAYGLGDCAIEAVPDEVSLLKRFVQLVLNLDPDILVGYEVQMASVGYLSERGSQLGFDLCRELGRIQEGKVNSGFGRDKDEWGFLHASGIHIPGRIVLNVWRILRTEVKSQMYSMSKMSEQILGWKVPEYTQELQAKLFAEGTVSRSFFFKHKLTCTRASLLMLDSLNIIGRTSELARVFGIDFFSVLSRGSQYRVESMLFRLTKPQNFILISPSKNDVAQQKAPECIPLVMEPRSRLYTSPVLVMDFQSLYPSIIIAYNYCYSTCLGKVEAAGLDRHKKLGFTKLHMPRGLLGFMEDKITISPNEVMFVNKSVRTGVLPRMLREILETRIMVKQALKRAKGQKSLEKMLDSKQYGLKMIANVTYGYTSATFSGRMPCIEIADAIVETARRTLENAIKLVNENPEWRAEVVYGDTDSMFVHLPGRTRQEAFDIGNQIAQTVTRMNPDPVKLQFEKVFHPCVLISKKRYVGYKYESPDQTAPEMDAKGIETVRRDTCPAVQRILRQTLEMLFETKDLSRIKGWLEQQWSDILGGRVNPMDFVFAKEVRLGTYRGQGPAAAQVAAAHMRVDPRAEPRYGERVPYLVVCGAPGSRLVDMVVSPAQFVAAKTLRIHTAYYINNQIIPPLERVLKLVGAEVYVVPQRKERTPGKKTTLDQYYTARNCAICYSLTSGEALAMPFLIQRLFGAVMRPQLENVELDNIDPVAPSRTRTAAPTPTLDTSLRQSSNSSSVDVAPKGRSVQSSDAGASDLLSTAHDADDHREDADLFPRLPDGAISSGPAADDQAHAGEADEEEEEDEEEASNPLLPGAVVTTFVIPHEGFYSPRVPSSSTSSAVPAVPTVSAAEENHVILTSLFGRLGDVDASLNTLLPCCQGSQNALWTDAPSASRTTAAISPVVSRAVLNTPADETPRPGVHRSSYASFAPREDAAPLVVIAFGSVPRAPHARPAELGTRVVGLDLCRETAWALRAVMWPAALPGMLDRLGISGSPCCPNCSSSSTAVLPSCMSTAAAILALSSVPVATTPSTSAITQAHNPALQKNAGHGTNGETEEVLWTARECSEPWDVSDFGDCCEEYGTELEILDCTSDASHADESRAHKRFVEMPKPFTVPLLCRVPTPDPVQQRPRTIVSVPVVQEQQQEEEIPSNPLLPGAVVETVAIHHHVYDHQGALEAARRGAADCAARARAKVARALEPALLGQRVRFLEVEREDTRRRLRDLSAAAAAATSEAGRAGQRLAEAQGLLRETEVRCRLLEQAAARRKAEEAQAKAKAAMARLLVGRQQLQTAVLVRMPAVPAAAALLHTELARGEGMGPRQLRGVYLLTQSPDVPAPVLCLCDSAATARALAAKLDGRRMADPAGAVFTIGASVAPSTLFDAARALSAVHSNDGGCALDWD